MLISAGERLLDLVSEGLVIAERATMKGHGRAVEVARVKITDTGLWAIDVRSALGCIDGRPNPPHEQRFTLKVSELLSARPSDAGS